MFAIAARYSEDAERPVTGKVWEAGCGYLYEAQDILSKHLVANPCWNYLHDPAKTFCFSRTSTVQALLLLGNREFGMGKDKH